MAYNKKIRGIGDSVTWTNTVEITNNREGLWQVSDIGGIKLLVTDFKLKKYTNEYFVRKFKIVAGKKLMPIQILQSTSIIVKIKNTKMIVIEH